MRLSVIIPAYNEERVIKSTTESIYRYLSDRNIEHEIIISIDGAKDRTAEIAENLKTSILTLKVLNFPVNHGKGYVVTKAMLEATGDFRLFTDADNSTSIDHLDLMMPYFDQGFDVVIGSIAVSGHTVAKGSEPAWRRLFGKLGNLFIQIMAVPGIHDTQRGFKVVSARAAKDIFPRMTIDRFGFDVEMLALARKFGYKIKEVPVQWKNDPNSHVGLKAYAQVLMETVRVRWNLLTGKYNNE